MFNRVWIAAIVVFAFSLSSFAADEAAAGAPNLIGKDFTGWKLRNEKASHWKIGGDVKLDPANARQLEVSGQPGDVPILVNDLKEKQHGCDAISEKEFGDCEVHVELMVPKGSNSGVYLMGRYEVQVFDSYNKKNPSPADLGGIYATHAPDAANYQPKAPGEWQTLDIVFQAPRFDNGKKTADAKFVSVKLNGQEIQKDVDTPKPTGSEISNKEASTGPIMLQGDHGAVAFRNLRVKEAGK